MSPTVGVVEVGVAPVFVVMNPVGGSCDPLAVRAALDTAFGADQSAYRVYETSGAEDEDITALVHRAIGEGAQLIVAVGGDGTVSQVAEGLIGGDVPLGIIPGGTANVLAQELGLPTDVAGAAQLLAGEHRTRTIDMLKVGERHFVLAVSIGLESLMIANTGRQAKRRFGRLAYIYTAFAQLIGFEQPRFTIVADGKRSRPRALQVLVANGGTLGIKALRWGPDIELDDGVANLCIVSARTFVDYIKIIWFAVTRQHRRSVNLRYIPVRNRVTIATSDPLPVQADGEVIGTTPLTVEVVAGALKVVVPNIAEPAASGEEMKA